MPSQLKEKICCRAVDGMPSACVEFHAERRYMPVANTQAQRAAPYVPWGTFRNQLDKLSSNGLPNRVDKSAFTGLAGGTQTQVVAAMKFLGLVDEETEEPTALLKRLVSQENELARKPVLEEIFRSCYAELFGLDLMKATPDQFDEAMRTNYNVTGSTLLKAVRFFLHAAEDLGIEVGEYLKKAGKRSASNRKRKKKPAAAATTQARKSGTSKTVELASGGSLTLSATVDLFALNPDDRTFIFDLIDRLEKYETNSSTAEDDLRPEKLDNVGGSAE